ncbi:MAG: hypothetical protein OEY09_10395 [Gammaproteobacteria bacterium]|nr:hypothetical protein [Gammaproteobacteria bacterium]
MANKTIGHVKCLECGEQSEVRMSEKNNFAYHVCPGCGNQSFCRSRGCSDGLLNRMEPVGQAGKDEPVKEVNDGFFN